MARLSRVVAVDVSHHVTQRRNHVHLIATPEIPESLPVALKATHGRYAAYLNACRATSGHVWQGRYYSCPLGERHFWRAMRYVELNLVRAGLVEAPSDYRWSSAAAHCGNPPDGWTGSEWRSSPPRRSARRASSKGGRR